MCTKQHTAIKTIIISWLLLAGSNSWAQSVSYNVTSANTFNVASNPLGGVSGCALATGTHYYASQQFTVPSNGTYTIETTSSAMTFSGTPDTFIALYSTAFNPASPTTGLVACNDDNGTTYLSKVMPTLTTGTTYTIVITSYKTPSAAGTDTVTGAVTASFTPTVTAVSSVGSKTNQTITFSPALTGTVGTTANLSATASSGLATTIASSTPTICTLSGTTLSFAAVGTCTVTANQAGNTSYNAATQISANIAVSNAPKTNQTITFNALSGKTFGDADFTVSATASSTLPVIFSATGSCSIANSTVKITAAGDCSIKASQAGDTKYNAATDVTQTFVISKANQTLIFNPSLTGTAGQNTTLSATGGLSNNAIVFASSTPTICTVTGNSVSFASVGTCTITANQTGNTNYNAATQVSVNIVVSNAPKTDQTISFSPALTGTVGMTANLSATSTSGLTAITFASSPATVCTISGNTVSFVSAGNCIVTANQVGNDKFNAAKEVSATIVVSTAPKTDQTISFSPTLTGTVGTTANLSATSTSGLTAITFASSPATVCTISGNSVSFVSAGNCIVTANQVGNDKFNAAKEMSATIVVSTAPKTDQTISFSPTLTGTVGTTANLSATASSGLTAITFASSTLDICTVNPLGPYIHFWGIGNCIVTANQVGNDKFSAAKEVSANIVVSEAVKKDQVVTINSALYVTSGDTATLSATTDSGLTPVTFTSYPVEICELMGNNIAYKAEGICTIAVKQAGNEKFNPVEKNFDVSVLSKGIFSLNFTDANANSIFQALEGDSLNISLTFNANANANDVGKTAKFYLKAMAGNMALMLTDKGFVTATEPLQVFTSVTLPADQITLPLYSGVLPAGKYSVYAAYQTDDGKKEEAASVFTVKAKQTVTFTNLPESAVVGKKVDLTLTGGGSKNPIVLTSATADICTVQGRTVTFIAEGSCTIEANQAGNETVANGNATGIINVKSLGVFSLSVTDKDGNPITQAINVDTLNIGLTFKAPTDDIGKTATFYLTASKETVKWMLIYNHQWREVTDPLQGVVSGKLPADTITLALYTGFLPVGKYTVSAKYQIADKIVEATSILNVTSKVYADAYATAKASGKSEDYATTYAKAYERAKGAMRSNADAHTYANTYASAKAAGKSDSYAYAYITARVNEGNSNAYAITYAAAKDAGKSEDYARAAAKGK